VPVGSRSSTFLQDAAGLRTDPPVTTLTPGWPVHQPAPAPSPRTFELRCADAHPANCTEVLRAERVGDVVALTREHGALVHGFTTVWYRPQRLATMAAAVTRRGGESR